MLHTANCVCTLVLLYSCCWWRTSTAYHAKPHHGGPWVRHMLPHASAQELSAAYEHQHRQDSVPAEEHVRGLKGDTHPKPKPSANAVNESQLLASHLLKGTDVAVCVCIKDQWPDTWEWLMYHMTVLGIKRFYIFDNNSTQPMLPELLPLVKDGTIVYHYFVFSPWHFGPRPQLAAYTECLQTYGRYHGWMAMIDADEFIVLLPPGPSASPSLTAAPTVSGHPATKATPHAAAVTSASQKSHRKLEAASSPSSQKQQATGGQKEATSSTGGTGPGGLSTAKTAAVPQALQSSPANRTALSQLLDQARGYGGLAMNWLMFGADGREERPEDGVLGNYLHCFAHNHVKVIVDPRMVTLTPVYNPHVFNYLNNATAVTADGRNVSSFKIEPPCVSRIMLHHYVTKSKEEYKDKMVRGGGSSLHHKTWSFFNSIQEHEKTAQNKHKGVQLPCDMLAKYKGVFAYRGPGQAGTQAQRTGTAKGKAAAAGVSRRKQDDAAQR